MSSTINQRLRRFNGTDYDRIYLSANVSDSVGILSVSNGGTGNSSADTTPTANSTKMVTSGGIYNALSNKADSSSLTSHTGNNDIHVTATQKSTWDSKQDALTFDSTPESGSTNPVTSGGIYTAIQNIANGSVSTMAPGNTVMFDNKLWICTHLDGSYAYLLHYSIVSKTAFGSSTSYSGSTLASVCSTWQANNMSSTALALCQSVTVNGVTSKVFVPSYKMMSGTASSDGVDANDPTWEYMANAPAAGADGSGMYKYYYYREACYNGANAVYWLSSPRTVSGNSFVWAVIVDGTFTHFVPNSYTHGFRPAVKVKYKN